MAQGRERHAVRAAAQLRHGLSVLGPRVHQPQDGQAGEAAQVRAPAPWRGGLASRVGQGPLLQPRLAEWHDGVDERAAGARGAEEAADG